MGNDPPGAGGKLGGERSVGDARPSADMGNGFGDPGRQRLVAAEVTGRAARRHRADTGAHDLHARAERFDRRHHRLEGPGLAVGIMGGKLQPWTAGFGLPPAQSPSHSPGACCGRARHHPVGEQHSHRLVG